MESAVTTRLQPPIYVSEPAQTPKRDNASANAPIPASFWHLKTAAKPDQLVDLAVNKVTQARSRISRIASRALIDLPDPLTYKGTDFNWSDEDRRVLAIIRLQGSLERDALRSLASIAPQAPLGKDLLKLHSPVDEAFAASKEQRKLLGKSMNGFIAFVPKGNPYEPQRNAALAGLLDLRKLMEAEATLPAELSFLFDEVSAVSESIESIIFGSRHGTLSASLGTGETSKERFEDLMAADEKKELAAIQAEADRKQKEQQQLAAAQLREQNALEEQRKREEERKRAAEERKRTADERLVDLSSGGTGRGFGGRGRAESSEPFGPRPDRSGTPSRANGHPTDRWGRGPQAGPPSDLHAPGNGQPALPQNQFQRPPAKPSDPALKVTITAANVKNVDSST